jgi:hypothetical protein
MCREALKRPIVRKGCWQDWGFCRWAFTILDMYPDRIIVVGRRISGFIGNARFCPHKVQIS